MDMVEYGSAELNDGHRQYSSVARVEKPRQYVSDSGSEAGYDSDVESADESRSEMSDASSSRGRTGEMPAKMAGDGSKAVKEEEAGFVVGGK